MEVDILQVIYHKFSFSARESRKKFSNFLHFSYEIYQFISEVNKKNFNNKC